MILEAVLLRASGFLIMIVLGYGLKRIGLFSLKDSELLGKLILKITLPMTIVSNFRTLQLDASFLTSIGLGFGVNFAVIGLILFITRKMAPPKRAFYMINTAGYNIGLCTLPYLQSFFAPEAVAVVCMFDVGNAIMCFGITFTIAMMISKGRGNVSRGEIVRTLFSSMPFVTYLIMITLCALNLRLPSPVYDIAGMIGQANGFLAMILIGILFEPKINKSELRDMLGVFSLRMVTGTIFAVLIYQFLPLPLLHRQVLCVVVFSPILSVAPLYTERCGYNRGPAAVLNSLMLPFSMVVMTILLLVLRVY